MLNPDTSEFENSIDPDRMASSIFRNIRVNIWNTSNLLDRIVCVWGGGGGIPWNIKDEKG